MVPLPGFFLINFGFVCCAATVLVVLKPTAEAALVVCALFPLLVDISHLNIKQVNMGLSTKDCKFHKINDNVSKKILQTGQETLTHPS